MIQALTHSDRDICPDERIVQLSHVILGSWSAVRQMALQSSRARWCKPLNLAALPSHAESPSVLLPRHPSHRSPSHRCLHRRHSHYGYCSPHPCSCGQPARTRKTDKALKVINFATCNCAPSACFFELEKGQRISFSQLLRWLSMQQNTGACCRTSPRRPRDALSPGVCVPHGARASQEQLLQLSTG